MAFILNSRFIKVVQSYVKAAVGFAAVSVCSSVLGQVRVPGYSSTISQVEISSS